MNTSLITIPPKLLEDLNGTGITVISGMAYGIDVCAHKAALKNQLPTVGVLAHGLDRIYPAVHKNVAVELLKKGGLLTDFWSNTNPDRENFVKRNRIVAGLCDAILVTESGIKGGSMITARIAHGYNRDVFAVPGRPSDLASIGCNFLIQKNMAQITTNATDIGEAMNLLWNVSDDVLHYPIMSFDHGKKRKPNLLVL
mgnify:CR=1 FL=1